MIFKSLANNQIGYAWQYNSNYTNKWGISYYANQFDTYGDGMIQHSSFYPVRVEQITDYLYSLAAFLQDNLQETDNVRFPSRLEMKEFLFYKSIKYKADKTQYYCTDEQKISASVNKRYDKRWEEVPDWADQSPLSIYRLARKSHHDTLDYLGLLIQIQDYWTMLGEYLWINPKTYGFETEEWDNLVRPYKAVKDLVDAEWLKEQSRRRINNYLRKLNRVVEEEKVAENNN